MLEGFRPVSLTIGLPSVSITSNGVTFNKSAIVKLDKPENVVLMLNEAEKMMAVQACDSEDANATTFFKPNKRVVSVRWNNKDLLNTLSKLMIWDLDGTGYKINGEFLNEEKALVFDLKNAEVLDPRGEEAD